MDNTSASFLDFNTTSATDVSFLEPDQDTTHSFMDGGEVSRGGDLTFDLDDSGLFSATGPLSPSPSSRKRKAEVGTPNKKTLSSPVSTAKFMTSTPCIGIAIQDEGSKSPNPAIIKEKEVRAENPKPNQANTFLATITALMERQNKEILSSVRGLDEHARKGELLSKEADSILEDGLAYLEELKEMKRSYKGRLSQVTDHVTPGPPADI